MRQRRAGATAGTLKSRFPLSKQLLMRAALAMAVVWMASAFAQEAWTAYRLGADATALRQHNAALAAQNQSYARDIASVKSGAAAEEVARQNGYARPGEHVYVVATPPPAAAAAPVAGPAPTSVDTAKVVNSSPSLLDVIGRWLAGAVHRR